MECRYRWNNAVHQELMMNPIYCGFSACVTVSRPGDLWVGMEARGSSCWRETKAVISLCWSLMDLYHVKLAELKLFPRISIATQFQSTVGIMRLWTWEWSSRFFRRNAHLQPTQPPSAGSLGCSGADYLSVKFFPLLTDSLSASQAPGPGTHLAPWWRDSSLSRRSLSLPELKAWKQWKISVGSGPFSYTPICPHSFPLVGVLFSFNCLLCWSQIPAPGTEAMALHNLFSSHIS